MIKKTKRSNRWVLKKEKRKYAGIHLIVEFWNGKIIENPKKIGEILTNAAKKANNTPLKLAIHKFNPQGITGVILLAESHIAIHSWPELKYLAIDIFTCGNKSMPRKALNYLNLVFKPKKVIVKTIKRGNLKDKVK